MSLLSAKVSANKSSGRKSLVAYLVAGDPSPDMTVPLMQTLVAAGVDVIELGVPFSDPEAEGPVIQLAHERALAAGTSLLDCLDMVAAFRLDDAQTPVVLMGYLNPVEKMGYESFAGRAAAAGVNGTILVNLPPEEAADLDAHLKQQDIDSVYLLAPTTTDERAEMICKASRGFVYYVSLKGTTGAGHLDSRDVASKLARFRQFSKLPILVGFGVRDADSARAVARVADGVVVGSAIVSQVQAEVESHLSMETLKARLHEFVATLREAIDE